MTPATATWSPWRTVLTFGYVSLAADMVYEGMRSASGPLLLSLGASAAYGVFATAQGLGALGGGALAGGLYEHHLGLLIAIIAGLQVASLATLVTTVRLRRGVARV